MKLDRFFFQQEIPAELHSMAERYGAWKERKDEERKRNQIDAGGGRGGGGGASGRGCFKVPKFFLH